MSLHGAPVELCSVDVWDTLLRRRCHPDAVKLHVANLLLERAAEAVATPWREPRALLKARLAAEAEAAKRSLQQGHDDEYTLAEVLNEWLGRVAPGLAAAARDALAADLSVEEWRQEEFVCYADPGIEAFLSQVTARRWIFISDFYLSAERLFALLHARGLSARFSDGYSSCDVRRNKRSGRLYRHVQAMNHVAPAQHLHVGNEAGKDVRVPRKLGMPALQYRNDAQEALTQVRTRWLQSRPALFAELHKRCRALAQQSSDEAYRHGLALAPLLAGFAQFIHEQARRDGVARLLFCTREGALFARACEVLRKAAPHRAGGLPEPELFEVSRASTFAASLADGTAQELQRLWRSFPDQTVAQFCATLGIDIAALAAAPDARMSPELLRELVAQRALAECIARRRGELTAYLRSRALPEQRRVGLVDVGWRGSIADNLALVAPALEWRGYYLGLQPFLNPQPANVRKHAFGPNLNESPAGEKLFRDLPLLELVCGSAGGSVSGYRLEGDGGVSVIRSADVEEDGAFAGAIRDLQAGMLAGVEVWAEAIHTQALSAGELRAPALEAWGKLLASTPGWLARLRERHKHDERFGRGRFAPVPPRRSLLGRLLRRARAGRASTS